MLRVLWMQKRTNESILKELVYKKGYPPYAIYKFSNSLHA